MNTDQFILDTFEGRGGTLWDHDAPDYGYVVSISGHELDFEMPRTHEHLRSIMTHYIESKQDEIKTAEIMGRKLYVGSWVHEGRVYLDLSMHTLSLDSALLYGKLWDQQAIWDIKAGEAIPLV